MTEVLKPLAVTYLGTGHSQFCSKYMRLYPEDNTMNNKLCKHNKCNKPFSVNDELCCMVTFISYYITTADNSKNLSCCQLVKHILIVFCIMRCQNRYRFLFLNKRRRKNNQYFLLHRMLFNKLQDLVAINITAITLSEICMYATKITREEKNNT
jgi:hypothetical protein